MIESEILKYIDLGDNLQKLYIYNKKTRLKFFKLLIEILNNKIKNIIITLILKVIFFLQIMNLSLINMNEETIKNDSLFKLLKNVYKIFYISNNISNRKNYIYINHYCIAFCLIIIILLIYIYIMVNYYNTKYINFSTKFLNLLNLILQDYALCQLINIFLLSSKCKNKKHIYLNEKCFSNLTHILFFVISTFFLIFIIFYSFIITFFLNEIGLLKIENSLVRINNNSEILENFCCVIIYTLSYIQNYYLDNEKETFNYVIQGIICLLSIVILIYEINNLFYYVGFINYLYLFGWSAISWFNFLILMKIIIGLNDISIFFIIGLAIIYLIIILLEKNRIDFCLMRLNIFKAKSLKQIETFVYHLLDYANNKNFKNQIILEGIIQNFQETIKNVPELITKNKNFLENNMLISKFGDNQSIFQCYNIIILIYEYFINQPKFKNDFIFVICYFYINSLKNFTYPAYLLSINKFSNLKEMFLHFTLTEKIKNYQTIKLLNNTKKKSIKKLEISSVILYNYLVNEFKLNIYEAVNKQNDYFEILKNKISTNKTSKNFIKTGKEIIKIKKNIIKLYKKILKLNPFNEENEKDYFLYLENIIKDNYLAQKKYDNLNQFKNNLNYENNKIYYQMFDENKSGVILVDGYLNLGKIIYYTPNFPSLINYLPKEISGFSIYDFQPVNIAKIHNELIHFSLKYSNISFVFNKFVQIVVKGKNNSAYKAEAYLKCLPSLERGIIYIVIVEKIKDKSFIFVLDDNLNITSMSDPISSNFGNSITITNNALYNLNSNLIGRNISIVIPEILKYVEYKNNKFNIFKVNKDIKATLYPNISNINSTEKKIDIILDKIKQSGILIGNDEIENYNNQLFNSSILEKKKIHMRLNILKLNKDKINNFEYLKLIKDLDREYDKKSFKIFFHVHSKSFINGKYNYYTINISDDIFRTTQRIINNTDISQFFNTKKDLKFSSILDSSKIKVKNIKIHVDEDDEEKNLLLKEKKKKDFHLLNNNNNNNENISVITHMKNSDLYLNSNSFIELKNILIKNIEPNFISYMRFILIIYCIISIIIIYIDINQSIKKFENLRYYLYQNLIFNRTKICASCFYNSALNLLQIKYNNILFEDGKNNLFFDYYIESFNISLSSLIYYTQGFIYYDKDFQKIFHTKRKVEIVGYNEQNNISTTMDVYNYIYFFESNSLVLYNNYLDFLDKNNNEYNSKIKNFLNLSYYYCITDEIKGFSIEEINEKKKSKKFKKSFNLFYVNLVIFIISYFSLFYFLVKFNKIEMKLLKKLIKFNNLDLENYIKYLSNLKKTLKNESHENEDSKNVFGSENQNNNISSNILTNELNDNKNSLIKKSIINTNINNKNEEENLKSPKRKKKKNLKKIAKISQLHNVKFKIMKVFFNLSNFLFIIKFSIILITYMSYYFSIFLLYNDKLNFLIEFYKTNYLLNGKFKKISEILIKLRKQDEYLLTFNYYKEHYISLIKNSNDSISISFNNKIYSKNNVSLLENLYYHYEIEEYDYTIPQIENILLPLIKDQNIGENNPYSKLKQLFQGNSCELIFNLTQINRFNLCKTYWSGIFLQGLEQVFIQLEIEKNNYLRTIKEYNENNLIYEEIVENIKNFYLFFDLFFLPIFRAINTFLSEIRENIISNINNKFNYIMWFYIIIEIILCILAFFVVNSFKNNVINFFLFIEIIPVEFIIKDESFFNMIIKLMKHF